jgi:hypothetical protein
MNFRLRKLAPAALIFIFSTAAGAQPLPTGPIPPPPEGCRIWEAHILSVIEQYKRGEISEAARGEALSIAYAVYGKCVMCATDKDMNENAVSALKTIQLVLTRGREVAVAD